MDASRLRERPLLLVIPIVAVLAVLLAQLDNRGRSNSDLPSTLDGQPVLTVSQVLAARAAGALRGGPVTLGGYWSGGGGMAHSCAPPAGPVGDLQLYCHDGEYGITERDEPIFVVDRFGSATHAVGPNLTPYIDNDLPGANYLVSLPYINGQPYPPVPIVVVGHFDDPRAADCAPDARQLCLDRLVLDAIAIFDPEAVATPGITPTPTPFPSPPPAGMFGPEMCAGDVEYSFVGWTTTRELQMQFDREGHVWAMVTADVVDLGGGTGAWNDDPGGSGHRFRPWGRQICIAQEGQEGVIEFGYVPGSGYLEWDDGRRTEGLDPNTR